MDPEEMLEMLKENFQGLMRSQVNQAKLKAAVAIYTSGHIGKRITIQDAVLEVETMWALIESEAN